jgi:hypothetical protein
MALTIGCQPASEVRTAEERRHERPAEVVLNDKALVDRSQGFLSKSANQRILKNNGNFSG